MALVDLFVSLLERLLFGICFPVFVLIWLRDDRIAFSSNLCLLLYLL